MPVYMIRDKNRVKIGHGDPVKRLRALQTGNPRPLTIVAVDWLGGPSDEKELHRRFDSGLIQGEWFDWFTPGLKEWARRFRHVEDSSVPAGALFAEDLARLGYAVGLIKAVMKEIGQPSRRGRYVKPDEFEALRRYNTFVAPEQVAERLGVSPATVQDWIQSGRLPAVKRGPKAGRIFIRKCDLDAFEND